MMRRTVFCGLPRNVLQQLMSPSTHPISQAKQLLRQYLSSKGSDYFLREGATKKKHPCIPPRDLATLHSQLGGAFSKQRLQRIMYRLLDTNGPVTEEKRRIVRDYLAKNAIGDHANALRPTHNQFSELAQLTNLGRYQIYALVERELDPPGAITNEAKHEIEAWLRREMQHDPSPKISFQCVAELARSTRLSRRQVYATIHRMLDHINDPPGHITKHKRDELLSWWRNHIKESQSTALPSDISTIQQKLSLSKKQITSILQAAKQRQRLRQKIAAVRQELRQGGSPHSVLASKFGLPLGQVRRLSDSLQPLTSVQRDHILTLLVQNDWNPLPKSTLKQLSPKLRRSATHLLRSHNTKITTSQWRAIQQYAQHQETDLTSFAKSIQCPPHLILNTLRNIDNPPGIITEQNRRFIQLYIQQAGADLTSQQVIHLQQHTNLTKRQVMDLVRYYTTDAPGQVTAQKRILIGEYLREHPECLNDAHHMSILRDRTGLNTLQTRGIASRLSEKSLPITRAQKEQVRSFLLHRTDTTVNITAQLAQLTGLSKTQIKNLIRELGYAAVGPEQKMTPEKKARLLTWLEQHQYQRPTSDEYTILQEELNLNKRQLMNAVSYEIRKTRRHNGGR